jgi:hypothetical protein
MINIVSIGIGLIEKCFKNKIRWKGTLSMTEESNVEEELMAQRQDLERLMEEERDVDLWIKRMQDSLLEMGNEKIYSEYAYVTFEDIKKLNHCEENEKDTLLAISAPAGTTLEVPDPDQMSSSMREMKELYVRKQMEREQDPIVENMEKQSVRENGVSGESAHGPHSAPQSNAPGSLPVSVSGNGQLREEYEESFRNEYGELADKKYQIFLNSKTDEIMVYMITAEKEPHNNISLQNQVHLQQHLQTHHPTHQQEVFLNHIHNQNTDSSPFESISNMFP